MWEIKSCKKTDECYPKVLRNLASAPEILYYVGDIGICNNMVIAVVGKREAELRYLQIAKKIGELLAKEGCTVLNGLAVGIDAYALEGAVSANGKASSSGNQFLVDMRRACAVHDMDGMREFLSQPDFLQMSLFDSHEQ